MSEELFGGVVPSGSPDLKAELAAKLADLVPEAIADGKVDVAKLRELLGSDASDEKLERFGLFWPGKRRALQAAQELTTATLLPDLENSRDWETTGNVFIEGDNLEVLKILQRHYHGKIKMIYIDPPYNTGKDFVYPDNYKEGLASYLEWTKQVNEEGKRISTNSDTDGRYHSNWLSMMYPRLKLAKNLLTEDGAIFISIDDNELSQLRRLADEIFGESHFLGVIVWRTATDNNPTNIATDHEYVVVYAKNPAQLDNWETPSSKGAAIQAKYEELRQAYGTDNISIQTELRKWIRIATSTGDTELDGVSHYSYVDEKGVYYPGNSSNTKPGDYTFDIIHPVTGEVTAKPSNGWRWPESTFQLASEAGEVHWGEDHTTVPKIKKRLETATELLKSSYYEDNRSTSALVAELIGVKAFDNPKSVNLLTRLIRFASDPGDIVLDFFAGSGSTAHAVARLNANSGGARRWIMVQLPEPTPEKSAARNLGYKTISELCRTRISKSIDTEFENVGLAEREILQAADFGFRSFRLAESNFPVWRISSGVSVSDLENHINEIAYFSPDEGTNFDCLIEVLIKLGFSLNVPMKIIENDVFDAYLVGDGDFIAVVGCKKAAELDDFSTLLDLKPSKFLVMEDAYQGSDELKTNLEQECFNREIELIKK